MFAPFVSSQLNLQGLAFEYTIVRSQRKTAAIHVTSQGVQVRIPKSVSDAWVEEFVVAKQGWINTKLAQQQGKNLRIPVIELGQKVLFLGIWRTLVYAYSVKSQVKLEADEIIFSATDKPTQKQLLSGLQSFFKQQAKQYMVSQTSAKARRLKVVERLSEVVFRRTKSKWGHCTSRGRIQYNWLIMGAPEAVIDYLICHEVSHLIQANHSRAFWALVESMSPDYKRHQNWLNDHSIELSWC